MFVWFLASEAAVALVVALVVGVVLLIRRRTKRRPARIDLTVRLLPLTAEGVAEAEAVYRSPGAEGSHAPVELRRGRNGRRRPAHAQVSRPRRRRSRGWVWRMAHPRGVDSASGQNR